MTTPDVSLSPELMLSNLEFLAQLKLHDMIICDEKTGKIEQESRKIFLSLRAPGFHLETIEKTLLSSICCVIKAPWSDEATKIYYTWEKTKAGVEKLRDTFIYTHDLLKADSLKILLATVNTMSKDVLSEESKTAKIAKLRKLNAPIPQTPPVKTRVIKNKEEEFEQVAITPDLLNVGMQKIPERKIAIQRKLDASIPQPPPPPLKREAKTRVIRIKNKEEEFPRMAITPDLLNVALRKTPERERKSSSSGDNILVEAFQMFAQRKSSRMNPQKKEILDFDQNGYWIKSDEGDVKS